MVEKLNDRFTLVDASKAVEEYIGGTDWRIKANANTSYSNAGLINNSAGKLIANYWLDNVYSKEEGDAHRNGDYHIHDLDILGPYCCGHDLAKLLREGFNGVRGRISARPPKHFDSALDQMVNYIGILQAEWAGAQAFSSYDTYLAPYVFYDVCMYSRTYKDIKDATLSFIYGLNVPNRWGQCVPATYKCLKADGTWAAYEDLKVGDEIYVVDIETGNLKTDTITHLNQFDAPEKMHKYSNEQGFNFQVTPNHRVIYKTGSNNYRIAESESIKNLKNIAIPIAEWGKGSPKDFIGCRMCEVTEDAPITDKVWCPTTNTGTFVCLTDEGYVFFTGNSPFSNITIDWKVPNDLKEQWPMYNDIPFFEKVYKDFSEDDKQSPGYIFLMLAVRNRLSEEEMKTAIEFKDDDEPEDLALLKALRYKHFQKEMNLINKAFYECLIEGDINGLQFTFPIPTVNITEDFDWDDPNTELLFIDTAKYGHSYFQNFCGSQYLRDENGNLTIKDENAYNPNDVRSMCCRLRLDKTQIRKKGGGLFGSDSQTGCYDEETEVLTSNGWKHFKDVTFDDEFYTITPERKIELHKPINLFKYDFDGDMCRFKSDSIDLLVTPNHRMLLTHNSNDKFRFKEAKDCNHAFAAPLTGCWEGKHEDYYIIKAAARSGHNGKVHSDVKIDMDTWLKFLGLFISEGSVRGSKNGRSSDKYDYEIVITQRKIENVSLIDDVMSKMPYKVKKYMQNDTHRWSIRDKSLWEELRPLGCSYQKYIPEYVFNLQPEQLRHLFTYLVLGDGHVRKNNGHTEYYTSSVRLKNDVEHLAMLIGYGTNTRETKIKHCVLRGREVKVKHKNYTISFNISKNRGVRGYVNEYYKGSVYCVEVPNNTLYVRRNGKTVWCGNSVGVVTINAARLGYLNKGNKENLYAELKRLMDLAVSSLNKKRVFVQELLDRGLYPYTKRYLNTLDTFFSTIGILGVNEMIRNFTNDEHDITDEYGQKFAKDILDFMNENILEYQQKYDILYNLEASPGEGTTYRFGKEDLKRYPDIIHAGTENAPYYTNSTQLPVGFTDDAFRALDLQDELQTKYSGGTVIHLYMAEAIESPETCKNLVKTVLTNYRLPYISVTPTFSSCPIHGYISGAHEFCPYCDQEILKGHSNELTLGSGCATC